MEILIINYKDSAIINKMEKLFKVAINVAKSAGKIIQNSINENLIVSSKGYTNLVTDIDKAAEKTIIDGIKKEFPKHSIIAEESGSQINNSKYRQKHQLSLDY